MHIPIDEARKDDATYSHRNALKELKFCAYDVPHRNEITNEGLRFFAWLFRSALKMIEGKNEEIDRLKAEQPKWIPVDERLPDNYEKVLIFDKKWGILPGWHMKSGDWGTSEVKTVTEITYWMPNPEPPKGDEK